MKTIETERILEVTPGREKEILPLRKINYVDPYSWTDHCEVTVTLSCGLIAAGKSCPGCTAVNPQSANEAMVVADAKGLPRLNLSRLIEVREALKKKGINFITDMGGEPLTIRGYEEAVAQMAEDSVLDGLVYSSSIYFLKPDGSPTKLFEKYERAGLWSGAMYFLSSVDHLVEDRESSGADGSRLKSYYGLKLMEYLVTHGYNRTQSLGIHATIRKSNLDQIIPLYRKAEELGIWFSFCDLVHRPYTSRRKNPVAEDFYQDRLGNTDTSQLEGIIGLIIEEESKRLRLGQKRQTIPSSAFARMAIHYGPENLLNCQEHRQGALPNTFDVHPSGQQRACIAQDTIEDVGHCQGCAYISLDRGHSDYTPFETTLFGAKPGDLVWRNAVVNRKNQFYVMNRKNLVFGVDRNGLIAPFYTGVKYFSRPGDVFVNDGRQTLTDESYYSVSPPGVIFERR